MANRIQYFITDGQFFGQNGQHKPGKWCVGTVAWCGAIPYSKDFDTRDEAVAWFNENLPNYRLEGDKGVYIKTDERTPLNDEPGMKYTDEMMRVYLDYYAYDNNGVKTISIQHIGQDWCDYAILANGQVVMMKLGRDAVAQAARLCIDMGITINPVDKH